MVFPRALAVHALAATSRHPAAHSHTPPPPSRHESGPTNSGPSEQHRGRGTQPPSPPPPNPPAFPPAADLASSSGERRFNLLLSWADWRPSSWVDVLPALLEPMGVTSVRASSARQAEQVLRSTTIHVAVVDLSIPLEPSRPGSGAHDDASTEGGGRVLELLRRLDSPPPTVVLKAPHFSRDEARSLRNALACDAFAVVDRAAADAEQMLQVLQRALERFYRGRWPGEGPSFPSAPFRGYR